MMWPSKKE